MCLSVCYREICLPHFYIGNKILTVLLCDFTENTSFKSSGIICWPPLPSLLPDELSRDKRDSDGFFSTRRVCIVSRRSNKMTSSSLIIAHWRSNFLAICVCYKLLTCHCCMVHMIIILLRNCVCILPLPGKILTSLDPCEELVVIKLDMKYCSAHLHHGFCITRGKTHKVINIEIFLFVNVIKGFDLVDHMHITNRCSLITC